VRHEDLPGEGNRVRSPAAGPHEHQHDPAVHASGRPGACGGAGFGRMTAKGVDFGTHPVGSRIARSRQPSCRESRRHARTRLTRSRLSGCLAFIPIRAGGRLAL
jgi:hypothetical protein